MKTKNRVRGVVRVRMVGENFSTVHEKLERTARWFSSRLFYDSAETLENYIINYFSESFAPRQPQLTVLARGKSAREVPEENDGLVQKGDVVYSLKYKRPDQPARWISGRVRRTGRGYFTLTLTDGRVRNFREDRCVELSHSVADELLLEAYYLDGKFRSFSAHSASGELLVKHRKSFMFQ